MINYRVLQLLFLVSSMASQMIGMVPAEGISSMPFQIEGIAQRIVELPKELKYKILSLALALRETPNYEVYKKLDVGSRVIGIALTRDNTRALTGSTDNIVRIWDVEDEKLLKELKGPVQTLTSVTLSADGTHVLSGYYDGTVRVWNMDTGELITTLQVGSPVRSVALSADGSIALLAIDDGIACLYDIKTGGLLKKFKIRAGCFIYSVALSADGTLALTGGSDEMVCVWDTLTGRLLTTLTSFFSVHSMALSDDGAIVLTNVGNGKIMASNVKSRTLLNTLFPKSRYVYSITLSKDGKRALVGICDGNIQKIEVWNTKPLPGQNETSKPLTELIGHREPVNAVAFGSADFVASGSDDKTALIWKPFALEPRSPQENVEVLRQAYKETFSRPKFLFPDKK